MIDPRVLLQQILSDYTDADKWVGSAFENIKRLSNTKVGDVGQDFVEQLCGNLELEYEFPSGKKGKRTRTSPWDIKIESVTFEVKTATEDVNSSFQFNHIRHHRPYEALLCLGIAPDSILFDGWTKADVSTGKAGNLVTMDKGSSATFKLTRRRGQLRQIEGFKQHVLGLIELLRP